MTRALLEENRFDIALEDVVVELRRLGDGG
jgi:hypothetical protein